MAISTGIGTVFLAITALVIASRSESVNIRIAECGKMEAPISIASAGALPQLAACALRESD